MEVILDIPYLIHLDGRISCSIIIKSLSLVPTSLFLLNQNLSECAKSFIFFEAEVPWDFLLITCA